MSEDDFIKFSNVDIDGGVTTITSYQIELICRNSGRLSSKKGSHG